jgi:hypothetical protein
MQHPSTAHPPSPRPDLSTKTACHMAHEVNRLYQGQALTPAATKALLKLIISQMREGHSDKDKILLLASGYHGPNIILELLFQNRAL